MNWLYSIVYVLFIGALAHFWGAALPRDLIHPDRFPYKPYAWEQGGAVYESLGIRRWKGKLPDTSRRSRILVTKEIHPHMDSAALRRQIQETCVAEYVHAVLSLMSAGVLLIWKSRFGFFVWFLCFLGNLPYILVQRYNRPQLLRLLCRTERHEMRLSHTTGNAPEESAGQSAAEVY